MRHWLFALSLLACVKTNTVTCPDGSVCPEGTQCYTAPDAARYCLLPGELNNCDSVDDGLPCLIGKTTPGYCRDHVCVPAGCGDGFTREDEQCDGAELGAASNCTDLGYYFAGPLSCTSECSYDTSMCTGSCGDGIVSPEFEFCDGAPPARSCIDLGYGVGFLACSMCAPNVNDCRLFGWDSGGVAPVGQNMQDVHGIDDQRAFAVGLNAAVYGYDGTSWTAVDLSSCVDPLTFDAYAVWTFPASVVIGGVDSGNTVIVTQTSGGCSKTVIGAGSQVTDLWAASETDIYAVTAAGILHFDGSTWSSSSAATGLSQLWGAGPNDIYAVGGTSVQHRTSTGWSAVTAGTFTSVGAVWGSSASDVYVGGVNGGAGVVRHYNGATWSTMPAPPTITVDAGAIVNGRMFVAGKVLGGGLAAFDFDGTTWIDLAWPTTSVGSSRLWLSSAGGLYTTASDRARMYRFSGSLLADDILSSDPIVRVSAHTANEAYAVSQDSTGVNGGELWGWDGTVWSQESGLNVASSSVADVGVGADGSVYILETGVGLRRRTGPQTFATAVASSADLLWVAGLNDVWLANRKASSTDVWHWNGSALSPVMTVGFVVRDITGSSSTDVYIVGGQSSILHWNGAAWATVTSPSPSTANWWAVGTCGSHVFVGGAQGAFAHYDGSTWTVSSIPKPLNPTSIWCSGPDDVFLGTTSGYLYWFDGTNWSPVKTNTSLTIESVSVAGDVIFTGDQEGKAHHLVRAVDW